MKTIYISIIISTFFSFTAFSNNDWKSKYSNIEIKYGDNWSLIPLQIDNNEKTIVGIIDNSDKSSIVIKLTADVPKEQLSDSTYLEAIKHQMLNQHSSNKILNSEKIQFKGKTYYSVSILMHTKHGQLIQKLYLNRDGKKIKSIQISFPSLDKTKSPVEIPAKITKVLQSLVV
tara:strand:+ start:22 stop:540 length:519 start_codon:yes stop_codon:yes gene_type:complete